MLPATAGWFPAMRVVLHTGLGPVQVLQVHLRPPFSDSGSVVSGYFTTPPVREAEIEGFTAALDADLPTLIVGDFNEGPGGSAIAVLRERGMKTALPEFAPGETTWRWRTSLGTLHHTLDHIVYDGRLEPIDTRVLRAGRSDHLPVIAVFVAPPETGSAGTHR